MFSITSKICGAVAACLLGILLICSPADADQFKTVDNASAEEIASGMSEKAVRGLINVSTGWLEFPRQIYTNIQDHGPFQGSLVGPFMGIGMMVARTVAGALEIATFYLAYPGFYEPYLEPRYVWEHLDE